MEYNAQNNLNKWRDFACDEMERTNRMAAELATLRAENEMLREKLYDITGRSAMAFKQLHDSLLNQAKDALK